MCAMSTCSGMDLRAQEYGTLKVPYEMLNKRFRIAQKTLDREVHTLNGCFKEIEDRCSTTTSNPSSNEVVSMLDGVIDRLRSAKRKATDAIEKEEFSSNLCKRRVQHLKQHASPIQSVVAEWKTTRFYRMVVDHLLHCGFYDTALKLARECGITDLVNADVFITAREVEQSLEKKDLGSCLNWCHDNRSRLRKLKSNLEFTLHLQQFIELVRGNDLMGAVRHARKFFANAEINNQFDEVKQVMGLLVFNSSPHLSPYKELMSENRWKLIKEQFRYENYRLHQLGELSIFKVTLQAGLSGLKTHQCYDKTSKSLECPVCSPVFNKLADPLPFAHCAQSRIVCCITGDLMNENNHPMMLPNGYVYGEKGLRKIANDGYVMCPRSNKMYNLSSAQKLYVM